MDQKSSSNFPSIIKKKILPSLLSGSRRTGFTLLELLVVIAIVAILGVLEVPSLLGLSTSRHLSTAGNFVVGLINQARENSIAKNELTALVMIGNSGNPTLDNRLFVIEAMAPAVPGGVLTWTQVSRWELLPPGVVVDTVASSSNAPSIALQSLTYHGIVVIPSAYQIFLPGGGLMGSTPTPAVLRLVSGVWNGGTVTYTGNKTGNSLGNFYEVTINPYTGIPKVDRP